MTERIEGQAMAILGRLRFPRVGWIVLSALLGLASAPAYAQAKGFVGSQSIASIVYVPRDYGAPEVTAPGAVRHRDDFAAPGTEPGAALYHPHHFRLGAALAPEATESGWMRGTPPTGDPPGAPQAMLDIMVLAPPKLAHSLSSQPTLYWYVSGPVNVPIRVTLLDFEAADREPLLDLALGGVPTAGVYAMSLAKHGVHLERGHRYEWSVALEANPEAYPEEPVARTVLAIAKADPTLLFRLAGASPLARIEALAAAGYWYDALDLLGQQIAANDRSEPWRELCARPLEQETVGLKAVAAFARGKRGADKVAGSNLAAE